MYEIIISKEKFKEEGKLVKKILDKLNRILKLEKTFVEVYLIEDDFNVHSFEPPKDFPRPDLKGLKNLGEIYINPFLGDVDFLLIHGLLHLLGYDHKGESDKIRMEKKERELLKEIE